ncbi:hypothetical protein [Paraburkholderia terrae]|uniref:hypothetical protein n=1 Tax=Paraburkholderia terrae TaxID=311230 RepID=UPI001E4783F2|nr:hypothetical protein [Paraburkholderia terrae]
MLRILTDDLLDAVRLQHGKVRLDIKNVSLKEVASDAVASVQDGLEQRRLQLTVAGLDKDIILAGDYVREPGHYQPSFELGSLHA